MVILQSARDKTRLLVAGQCSKRVDISDAKRISRTSNKQLAVLCKPGAAVLLLIDLSCSNYIFKLGDPAGQCYAWGKFAYANPLCVLVLCLADSLGSIGRRSWSQAHH